MGELADYRKERLREIERYEELALQSTDYEMTKFYKNCAERERKEYQSTFKNESHL